MRSYQVRASWVSVFIHLVLIGAVILVGGAVVPVRAPIVIDFRVISQPESVHEQPAPQKPIPQRTAQRKNSTPAQDKSAPRTPPVEHEKQRLPELPDTAPLPKIIGSPQVPATPSYTQEGSGTSEVKTALPSLESTPRADAQGAARSTPEERKMRYLKEHFAYIRDLILKRLSYPVAARRMGWKGRVMVSFVINESGDAEHIKIIESSGFGILDNNAIDTIKKCSPFPKPPVRAELRMPVVYQLK